MNFKSKINEIKSNVKNAINKAKEERSDDASKNKFTESSDANLKNKPSDVSSSTPTGSRKAS